MILFRCDRCEREIDAYVHKIGCEMFNNTDYSTVNPVNILWTSEDDPDAVRDELSITLYGKHFCRDCFEKIAAYAIQGERKDISTKKEKVQPQPADDEMTESEEQEICERIAGSRHMAKGERTKIDLGKLKALWEANERGADWTITKIADELGCTDSAVHYHLKKMGLKK